MCGIHASICKLHHAHPSTQLQNLLCQRGPDHLGCEEVIAPITSSANVYLSFTSTVLALRGGHVTAQPFVDPATNSILCWNGEAWKIGGKAIEENDGEQVFQKLLDATAAASNKVTAVQAVLGAISSISGPFAFVYFDKTYDCVYFGRDRLGRRSLLYNVNEDNRIVRFSSLAEPGEKEWFEVEADGLYLLSYTDQDAVLSTMEKVGFPMSNSDYKMFHCSWDIADSSSGSSAISLGGLNREVPTKVHGLNSTSRSVDELEVQLIKSLKLRVLNIPNPPFAKTSGSAKVAVLFSGGLDCSVLARMVHDLLPLDQQIDLLNVAFENPRVLKAAQNAHCKSVNKTKQGSQDVKKGQHPTEPVDEDTISSDTPCGDLPSTYESCPDRITGRKAFDELKHVCQERTWRFVEINIPYSETISHRSQIISLIHPHNTEMDLSIAYALYFASRGAGLATTTTGEKGAVYTTTARVLLSGLGADELFAGYTRHATAFNRHSYEGLISELELDVNRLGKRNLGRDDRVISHWGREARFPYLDESFMTWALACPVWDKCGFGASITSTESIEIEPGKKVLRLLAARLGLVSVSQEKKRAVDSIWCKDCKNGDWSNKRNGDYLINGPGIYKTVGKGDLHGSDDTSDTAELLVSGD